MPVEKFRSIEDMNHAAVREPASDFDRFLRHCARFWTVAPRRYPRGVFRYRTIEEANASHSRFVADNPQ